MAKQKAKKQSYTVLLTSLGIHSVLVEGYSAEDACRTLTRKLAGRPIRRTRVISRLLEELWSKPSKKGEAWLVAASSRGKMNPAEVMSWNGETIKLHLPEGLVWSAYQGASKGSAKSPVLLLNVTLQGSGMTRTPEKCDDGSL